MRARLGHKRGQPFEERQRVEDDLARPVSPRMAQCVDDLAVALEREALGRDRRA
jgi:hypothetical protein